MTIPTITPKRKGPLTYISIEDYKQEDNEKYIFSRERFNETAHIISAFRNIDEEDLKDVGGMFAVVADNRNDALITVVAIAQVFTERGLNVGTKIVFHNTDFFIDQGIYAMSRNNPFILAANLEEPHSTIYEIDDNDDFPPDEGGHGLEFYITTPENADRIPFKIMSAVITIGEDTSLSPDKILKEYFEDRNYKWDRCEEELLVLAYSMLGRNEYFITSVAEKIVNDHLFNDPSDHILRHEDFANVMREEKKPVRRRLSNVELIGLEEERSKLNSIITEHYISRQRLQFGLTHDTDGCHIVFSGPPGTAKTTLARVYADRLAELGIISAGNFKECVKSDYIGQFVGQTTPKIEKLFSEMAERGGGVLFFDEIYTLSEKETTAFDREAVTSIVQNMENFRSKVFCVFAGYEEKMNEFLLCNPGLKSRITNTIKFKGYDDDTIVNIFRSMASAQGFKISGDCLPVLKEHFAKLRVIRGDNFGNGREARNLLVNAKQQQALRIGITRKPTKKALTNMTVEDIEKASKSILTSEPEGAKAMKPIGFNRTRSAV